MMKKRESSGRSKKKLIVRRSKKLITTLHFYRAGRGTTWPWDKLSTWWRRWPGDSRRTRRQLM